MQSGGGFRKSGSNASSWKRKDSHAGKRKEDVNSIWRQCVSKLKIKTGVGASEIICNLASAGLELLTLLPQEIEDGLLLVVQRASDLSQGVTEGNLQHGHGVEDSTWLSVCRVLCRLLPGRQTWSLSPDVSQQVLNLLLRYLECSANSGNTSRAQCETIWAICSIIKAYTSQGCLEVCNQVTDLMITLLNKNGQEIAATCSLHNQQAVSSRTLAFVLCQACCETLDALFTSQIYTPSAENALSRAFAAAINLLEIHSGDGCKLLDILAASRMYYAQIKLLMTLINGGGGIHTTHVPSIMECVVKYFQYGCVQFGADSLRIGSQPLERRQSGQSYVPPHQRLSGSIQGSDSASSSGWSGSETSDSDGSFTRGDGDWNKCVRVRVASLQLILFMAKSNGRSMHQHWHRIFPSRQPLQRSPASPHLVTVLAHDPNPKVRMAAATTIRSLFEGRQQKDFVAVAELQDLQPFRRSFTSLSMSLGCMIACLHEGILYSILNDTKSGVITSALQAMTAVISATNYGRMPETLLVRTTEAVRKRWHQVHGIEDMDSSVENAILALLRVAVSCCSSKKLREHLAIAAHQPYGHDMLSQRVLDLMGSNSWTLVDELLVIGKVGDPSVRVEVVSALTGISENYGELLIDRGHHLVDLITQVLSGTPPESHSHMEKAAQQGVKLIGVLAAEENKGFAHMRLLYAPMMNLLLLALKSTSPIVKSGALASLASLGKAAVEAMDPEVFSELIDTMLVLSYGELSSVRSAACRSIGALAAWECVQDNMIIVEQMVDALVAALSSQTIGVRISSSWALANLCHALLDKFGQTARSQGQFPEATINSKLLVHLGEVATKACHDCEKVQANAVRALGNALALFEFAEDGTESSWFGPAVDCLGLTLSSTGVKVQWNACYTVSTLLSGSQTSKVLNADQRIQLLSKLMKLVSESTNYKVQTQAAAALSATNLREHYGDVYIPAIRCLAYKLESLCSGEDQENLIDQAKPSATEEASETGFLNFRYRSGLSKQLESSVIHLVSLLHESDSMDFIKMNEGVQDSILQTVGKTVKEYCEHHGVEEREEDKNEVEKGMLCDALKALIGVGLDREYQLREMLQELEGMYCVV